MSTHLTTVNEKFSKYWPFIAVGCSVLAFLVFIYSRLNSDVLIAGYLELASFIMFAVAVLSFFKLRDGRTSIRIDKDGNQLVFSYLLNGSVVKTETLSIEKPVEFKTDRLPDTSLYSEINRTDRTVCFRETSSGSWRYLFQYNSRVIPISPEDAEKIKKVLTDASAAN